MCFNNSSHLKHAAMWLQEIKMSLNGIQKVQCVIKTGFRHAPHPVLFIRCCFWLMRLSVTVMKNGCLESGSHDLKKGEHSELMTVAESRGMSKVKCPTSGKKLAFHEFGL